MGSAADQATITEVLGVHANLRGNTAAFIFLGNGERETARCTFAQLHRAVSESALALLQLGLRGQRVLLVYQPGLDFIAAFFACLAAGVVAVPVSSVRTAADCSHALRIAKACGAVLALVDRPTHQLLAERLSGAWAADFPLHVLEWPAPTAATGLETPAPREDAVAFLQFTSGSTGAPKGVMVTHASIMANERAIRDAFGHAEDTVVLGWLPFHHDMGLIGMVMQPAFLGRPCVFMPPGAFIQEPIRWIRALSHYKATTSGGPNFGYRICVDSISDEIVKQCEGVDLSHWTVAFAGAEPLQASVLEAFARRFAPLGFRADAWFPCYGMAEATLMLTGGPRPRALATHSLDRDALMRGLAIDAAEDSSTRVVSCGRSSGSDRVAIVDPMTCKVLPDNTVGEIWASGPSIAQGYWNEPSLTDQVFRAQVADIPDRTFLRTGDLGYMRNGELTITGRLKDLIIVNGRNYAPHDIEATVMKVDTAFRPQTAAFSDSAGGMERIVVVQEVYPHLAKRLDLEAVRRKVLGAVASVHGVGLGEIVMTTGRLPVTTSGKVRRSACREAWRQGALPLIEKAPAGDANQSGRHTQ